jgi:predicted transcriptional regulator
MQQLTKAEEDIMQRIWDAGQVFVRDLITEMPEPKPNYNTVSSVVRILEKKGFVGHEAFGKTHRYHAVITKSSYRRNTFRRMLQDYFDGSHKNLLAYFTKEEGLDPAEIQRMLEQLPEEQDAYQSKSRSSIIDDPSNHLA